MATLIPSSNVEAAYEDMFKEITRKLYGEETGNGLHTLGTPVAQVATTGPTAPEGERSFTNLQIDRSTAPTIEYEHNAGAVAATAATAAVAAAAQNANVVIQQQPEGSVVVSTTGGNFKSEDHLSTAFGLAALMQNGFTTTTGTGGTDQQQTQIVQWTTPTTGGKLQSYTTTQQHQQQVVTTKSKSKNRNDHSATVNTTTEVIYASPSTSGTNLNSGQAQQNTPTSSNSSGIATNSGGSGSSRKKSHNSQHSNHQNGNNANNGGVQIQKRYACTHCPYSTDRRDLYTRHENIHKDEKPFQCFACLKQFNRADHVKKHFLRMHRELQYDINKTRRHVPSSAGGSQHVSGRGNLTITAVNSTSNNSSGSPEQKPNIFQATNVQLDNAFLEGQRQPTSSSLSIAETIEAVATAADAPLPQLKQEKSDDVGNGVGVGCGGSVHVTGGGGNGGAGNNGGGSLKPKREKRFTCCYCPWSGADKWGLKRHLNTHTKPFVCLLCDYKAARSERLATHVLKVHNKRACNKCSFLADTQEEYQSHINEVHPHDNRPARNNHSTNSNSSSNTNNNATNSLNVLRTIGNTLVTNNQLNTFQNASTTFGVGNNSSTSSNTGGGGGSVTIYTTTTTNDNGSGNLTGGGPLQEIIVNPTSMVGWRLSANGSLIPPHDLLTGALPNAAAQKRGSERLFQYLEADGSDPEDYARLLKMDAISRNTASVAQDFHKAGGVHELKIPANHQLLFNNKLPSQWTTKEAALLLHSLSNSTSFASYQQQQQQQRSKYSHLPHHMRQRQHSTGEDDENTPSSASSTTSNDGLSPMKVQRSDRYGNGRHHVAALTASPTITVKMEQRKAMSAFLSENFDLQETAAPTTTATPAAASAIELASSNSKRKYHQQHYDNDENQENQAQLIKSPPAYNKHTNFTTNYNNNNIQMKIKTEHQHHPQRITNAANNNSREHRLDLHHANKENNKNNAATFLTTMEYQNLNKIGTQIQNYVKDIINKYYAETPIMYPAMPTATTTPQQSQQLLQQQQQQQGTLQLSPKRKRSETEEYIEYLRNKEDITLTITPKVPAVAAPPAATTMKQERTTPPLKKLKPSQLHVAPTVPAVATPAQPSVQPQVVSNSKRRKSLSQLATLLPLLADAASQQQYLAAPLDFSKKPTHEVGAATDSTRTTGVASAPTRMRTPTRASHAITALASAATALASAATTAAAEAAAAHDKRSSRKQAQPKKIRAPPELVVAMLRDKYLNRMVDRKLSCRSCAQDQHTAMLVFNYHTKASLALHRLWKHQPRKQKCQRCQLAFKHSYSLSVHCKRKHSKHGASWQQPKAAQRVDSD